MDFQEGYAFAPEVASLDSKTVLISDRNGYLTVVNLEAMRVIKVVYVGIVEIPACYELRSLQTHSHLNLALFARANPASKTPVCVVAAKGYGVVWNLERAEPQRIYPDTGGSVSSTAYFPLTQSIAIGTGYYSLSENTPEAYLEIWTANSEESLAKIALPGVCVDSINFSLDGNEIVCVTGMKSQQQGFIVRVDTETLRPLDFIEIPFALIRQVRYLIDSSEKYIGISYCGGFTIYAAAEKQKVWSIDEECAFDYDHYLDEIFLANGQILSPYDGELVRQLDPLNKCSSVAVLPNKNGYVGVSEEGVLRHWQPN